MRRQSTKLKIALATSDERFRDLADDAPAILWLTDPDGSCSFLSRRWFEYTGQTEAEALGTGWLDAVHPEDREAAARAFLDATRAASPFVLDYRLRRADGAYRWAIDAGRPRIDARGELLGYVGSVIDIHERKEAEARLRDNLERLRGAAQAARFGTYDVDHASGTVFWSPEMRAIVGVAPDAAAVTALALPDFVHPDDRARVRSKMDAAVAPTGNGSFEDEHRIVLPDGTVRWVLMKGTTLFSGSGEGRLAVRTSGIVLDITSQKHGEAMVREHEAQLALITDALPVLVSFIDAGHCYRFVSAAYERWFGYARADMLGRHMRDVLGEAGYLAVKPYVEQALEGRTITYESEVPYQTGGTRHIEATYVPQLGADGRTTGFVALVADVSERKSFDTFRAAAAARAARLLTITGAIAEAVTADDVHAALVDHVAESMQATSAGLWVVDAERGAARFVRSRGYAEDAVASLAVLPLDRSPSLPVLDAIRLREPLWLASQDEVLARYPHLAPLVSMERPYRVACLPLIAEGRVLGVLGLTLERPPDTDERELLLVVSRYATQALERLRLLEAERRSRAEADGAARRLRLLNQASRAFAESGVDLKERIRSVVVVIGDTLHSTVSMFLLEDDGLLHRSAVHHPIPEVLAVIDEPAPPPLRLGEGVTGKVASTGESILLPRVTPAEVARDGAPSYQSVLARVQPRSVMCSPLRLHGRVIGVLTASRHGTDDAYGAEDLRLLEELADRAAIAIDNSRLLQETKSAHARAEQLYRFAQAVVVADRVEQVFDAALEAIRRALGIERSAILTFDAEGVMRFRAWRGLSDEYRNAVEGHSPWSRETVAPEPLIVADALGSTEMARFADVIRRERIGSLAFIPLVATGRLVGKFMIYRDVPSQFAGADIETVRAIANHLASVIARFAVVEKLEETIRSNELFAGALAHDLRTPLGAIMQAAQLALIRREGQDSSAALTAKPLGRILASGDRIRTMIDQLLDFTRARSGGGIDIHPRPANLASLCSQAAEELELVHGDWVLDREVLGDASGIWDPERLLQVISNLVANAGQHGRRDAAIRIQVDGSEPHHVYVRVHNEGAIPSSLLPDLFDPFRGTRHRRDHARGLGLGLFIVREIIRAHAGTVEVSSAPELGTTFEVRLPRHCIRRSTS